MLWIQEILCTELTRSLYSTLPWDIPWYDTSHVVFFAAVYGALGVIGGGLAATAAVTAMRLRKKESGDEHH